MDKVKILWADDEIEILKPHILFLEQKGYDVDTSNNGQDAIEMLQSEPYDIVFLDENMPGMSGIETLEEMKTLYPNLPIVMITKSEEESIMEDAIGSNIADYLIKPVKPNQILLSLKRNLDNKKLAGEKATQSYQQEFRNIGMEISNQLDYQEWVDVYKKLTHWELELERSSDDGIKEVLKMQKDEANQVFSKYIERNYIDWIQGNVKDKPLMSHTLMRDFVFPVMEDKEKPLFVLIIDNLRYDQWKIIQPLIEEFYRVEKDDIYFSILPSTTQYARNAIFSGLMPSEIVKKFPNYWVHEWEEGSKNKFEGELLGTQLKRLGKNVKYSYNKVLNLSAGKKLVESMPNLLQNKLNVIVYNFVDMLSHARTEMEIIRELAEDEAAYRSLMRSWFEHSSLYEIIRYLGEKNLDIVLTTDHGSVRVQDPVKIVGDKETNTNLRYKFGRSLNYNKKEVFEVERPETLFMPRANVSTSFAFCRTNSFFVYPNNYNYYLNYYKNTFQHGGISMEELMIPIVSLKAK
jgi:DNA-binding response OmpR family regulator